MHTSNVINVLADINHTQTSSTCSHEDFLATSKQKENRLARFECYSRSWFNVLNLKDKRASPGDGPEVFQNPEVVFRWYATNIAMSGRTLSKNQPKRTSMANISNEETIEVDDAASGQDQPQLLMINDTIEIDQSR